MNNATIPLTVKIYISYKDITILQNLITGILSFDCSTPYRRRYHAIIVILSYNHCCLSPSSCLDQYRQNV